jgi:IS1 family transposase
VQNKIFQLQQFVTFLNQVLIVHQQQNVYIVEKKNLNIQQHLNKHLINEKI